MEFVQLLMDVIDCDCDWDCESNKGLKLILIKVMLIKGMMLIWIHIDLLRETLQIIY